MRKAKRERFEREILKKSNIYFEKHHIIPRCLLKHKTRFKNESRWSKYSLINKPWNVVLLTAKEHYVAHHLLTKIKVSNKIGHQKLCNAFLAMCLDKTHNRKINSSQYETIRKIVKETGLTEEHKMKISSSHIGKKKSKESIEKGRITKKKTTKGSGNGRALTWKLTSPEGKFYETVGGLHLLCRQLDLPVSTIRLSAINNPGKPIEKKKNTSYINVVGWSVEVSKPER